MNKIHYNAKRVFVPNNERLELYVIQRRDKERGKYTATKISIIAKFYGRDAEALSELVSAILNGNYKLTDDKANHNLSASVKRAIKQLQTLHTLRKDTLIREVQTSDEQLSDRGKRGFPYNTAYAVR